ncbi:MAG: 4Fe-4S binding protein [Aigarchaeota archaeon]|nr:4Fe-4S binding protein [Aigarchaeota archaeon]MDW8092154.1 4Fe-4S binding protein [Nitrososphaerota archaeon]
MSALKDLLRPMFTGLKLLFQKPYTIKYPYEEMPNLPETNYRYDPKASIAYPGYKGRHVLYMDKCTGCSLCDIACSYVSEAITMVYAFEVKLQFDERVYGMIKQGNPTAIEAIDTLAANISDINSEVYQKRGASHPLMCLLIDLKQVTKVENQYQLRFNADTIWEHSSDLLVERYLRGGLGELEGKGWSVELIEDKSPESVMYKIERDGLTFFLSISKSDFKLTNNKKSYFPQVDYGRCVFCGLCVDACPFYALEMSPDVELSALERPGLVYNPISLAPKKISTVQPSINPIDAFYGWFRRKIRWE